MADIGIVQVGNGQGVNNVWYVANSSGFVPPVPIMFATTVPTMKPTIDYGSDSRDCGGGGYWRLGFF